MCQSTPQALTANEVTTTTTTRQLAPLSRKRSFVHTSNTTAVSAKVVAPPLHPVLLEPEHASPATPPAIAFLERVDRVAISETRERDGVTYYVLDVFLHRCDSRLPTVLARQRDGATRARTRTRTTPDLQVERRFSDFRRLRSDVFAQTYIDPESVCAYCVEFVMYVRLTLQQPRAITKFTTGTARRKTMLASFIGDFVRLGRGKEKQNRRCEHHGTVPQLIEAFLRGCSDNDGDVDASHNNESSSVSDPLLQSRLSWSNV